MDDITKDNIARVLWARNFEDAEIDKNTLNIIKSDKNSSISFGNWMRYKLQELIDNPDSFTPSYKKNDARNLLNTLILYQHFRPMQ